MSIEASIFIIGIRSRPYGAKAFCATKCARKQSALLQRAKQTNASAQVVFAAGFQRKAFSAFSRHLRCQRGRQAGKWQARFGARMPQVYWLQGFCRADSSAFVAAAASRLRAAEHARKSKGASARGFMAYGDADTFITYTRSKR